MDQFDNIPGKRHFGELRCLLREEIVVSTKFSRQIAPGRAAKNPE